MCNFCILNACIGLTEIITMIDFSILTPNIQVNKSDFGRKSR